MANTEFKPLAAPPITQTLGGKEILRAVIVDGGLQVSLVRGFEKADVWGILLADLARHASRIYARETPTSEDEALSRIVEMFQKEMAKPTDPGSTDTIQ